MEGGTRPNMKNIECFPSSSWLFGNRPVRHSRNVYLVKLSCNPSTCPLSHDTTRGAPNSNAHTPRHLYPGFSIQPVSQSARWSVSGALGQGHAAPLRRVNPTSLPGKAAVGEPGRARARLSICRRGLKSERLLRGAQRGSLYLSNREL